MGYHQKHPYLSSMWWILKVKLKEIICRHRFLPGTAQCHCDEKTGKVRITETCYKCGKIFTIDTTWDALNNYAERLHNSEFPERRESKTHGTEQR